MSRKGASAAGSAVDEQDLAITTVPLIDETVQVSKRRVDKGGYRFSKRVTAETVTVDEALEQQDVSVERRPVGRTLERGDVPKSRYEGNTWIVPVIREVIVTEKRLVLVEEVRVTTSFGTYRQPQQVTLRKEEISIERLDAEDPSVPDPS